MRFLVESRMLAKVAILASIAIIYSIALIDSTENQSGIRRVIVMYRRQQFVSCGS